ncbi:hypothetical protein [Glutamicibacter sp. JC586]|uniref:hypothetical protein n=1 Tax=Glutamicibacter sp. JC586 TaxID=2590552 RepID=UPI0013569673|nr:hypothetical protein [Glutamicibacter sp. JC586]
MVIDHLKPVMTESHPISAEELAALQGRALEAKANEAALGANQIDAEAQDLIDADAPQSIDEKQSITN